MPSHGCCSHSSGVCNQAAGSAGLTAPALGTKKMLSVDLVNDKGQSVRVCVCHRECVCVCTCYFLFLLTVLFNAAALNLCSVKTNQARRREMTCKNIHS